MRATEISHHPVPCEGQRADQPSPAVEQVVTGTAIRRHRTTSLLASTLANNMAARAIGRRMDAGDPLFREAVLEAAARIRERMEFRWLLVADPEARSACERAAIKRFRPEYNRQR